jgi:hypothetical protein
MQKYPRYSAGLCDTYVKAKTMKFVGFATENTGIVFFLFIANANHRFIASLR